MPLKGQARDAGPVGSRQNIDQLRIITDALPVGVAYVDQNKIYRFANQRFATAYGLKPEEIVGKHADAFIWHEAMALGDPFFEAAHEGTAVDFTHPARHADGRLLTVRTFLRPDLADDGTVLGFYVCSINVTKQKEAEAALLQTQKMDAVGQLASGIAHDFNNLLAVILGNLVEFRTQIAQEVAREYINPSIRAAEQAAKLTAQLLAVARRQPLQPQVLDVEACIADFLELLRRTLPPSIELNLACRGEPAPAYLDRAQFETALLNLCLNARDAMAEGGQIRIEIDYPPKGSIKVPVDPAVSGPFVRLLVSDTGIGMDEETAAHAFEPFFTTKDPGKGTGLGLSMVYGFVRQSRGAISVESISGKGTSFTLLLPIATDQQRLFSEPAPAEKGHGLVLLVDDNQDVRRTVRRQLARSGYTVIEADNGAEALELIGSIEDLHALVSDVVMPGMSGSELARKAAALRPSLRIVLMTGFDSDDYSGHTASMFPMLRKPFTTGQLIRAIEEAPVQPCRKRDGQGSGSRAEP
jgi:PAS domain S-box-containing protein